MFSGWTCNPAKPSKLGVAATEFAASSFSCCRSAEFDFKLFSQCPLKFERWRFRLVQV